jgi:hypothetical protein
LLRHSGADKINVRQVVPVLIHTLNGEKRRKSFCVSATFNGGHRNERREDMRTIPERIATYFRTAISLANLFNPGSRNEVEAAGLSDTATTIPLRKPRDDIRGRGWYMEGVEEEGRREGEGALCPTRSTLSRIFPGRYKKNKGD